MPTPAKKSPSTKVGKTRPAKPTKPKAAAPKHAKKAAANHDLTTVMAELEAMGTAQNRKVYPRHGAQEPMFGVSFANLGKLTKLIGTDQALAESLWETTNHDARMLATMIADPASITQATLKKWAKGSSDYIVAGGIAGVAAKSPHGRKLSDQWRAKTSDEWLATCGWDTLVSSIVKDRESPWSVAELKAMLGEIEKSIHGAPNRARHAMNGAVIAIGVCGGELEKAALATAKKIGTVEVDHGETSCKTPDAAAYIRKTLDYRAAKAAKAAAKTKRKATSSIAPRAKKK